jgi:ankyrin repeat protein
MKTNLEIAQLLIGNGANLNVKNNNGETPLNTALRYGSESIALLLIESGADVEAVVPNGSSVLSKAATRKNLKLVELIVKKGADPSRADGRGETPLYLAAESGSEEVFLFLLQAVGPNHNKKVNRVSPLFPAVSRKSYAITEALLKAGYDPNASLDSGITPIFIAAYKGSEDLAKLLADNGARLNIAFQRYGSPTHAAIIGGYPSIAQYFISAGVEPVVITDTLSSTYASAVGYHLYGKWIQHTNKANAKSALSLAVDLYKQVVRNGENAIDEASSSIWNNRISEMIYYTMLVAIGLDPTLATSSSDTLNTRLAVDNTNTQLENKQKHINELIAASKKAIGECQLILPSL